MRKSITEYNKLLNSPHTECLFLTLPPIVVFIKEKPRYSKNKQLKYQIDTNLFKK